MAEREKIQLVEIEKLKQEIEEMKEKFSEAQDRIVGLEQQWVGMLCLFLIRIF